MTFTRVMRHWHYPAALKATPAHHLQQKVGDSSFPLIHDHTYILPSQNKEHFEVFKRCTLTLVLALIGR